VKIMTLRSFLFVPGDSDKKPAKGATSGADALYRAMILLTRVASLRFSA
jgi:hypothetical protein